MPKPTGPVTGSEGSLDRFREHRDAHAWLRSTISYCEWRAGRFLRPWHERAERAARSEYQDAARILHKLLHDRPADASPSPQLVLRPLNPSEPGYTLEELRLADKPTKWLVDELMTADPRLTMRTSLMRLRRGKLARMLVQARAAASQPERRSA